MRNIVKIVWLITVWHCNHSLHAQPKDSISVLELFKEKLQDKLSSQWVNGPENIYITTDRPWYFPGEDIWFKAYITTGGLPFTQSGVLYVSFSDSSGKIVIKKLFLIDNHAVSYGTIKLPPDLKPGWYSLRAQTAGNRNFSGGSEKLLFINEKGFIPEKIFLKDTFPEMENSIEFFPAGANFVAGLQNHFGVKATGKNGKPAFIKGFIIDSHKDTLAAFETSASGLGEFTLPAASGHNLSAHIAWPDGTMTTHSLPEMNKTGIVLQATIVGDKLFYNIESKADFAFRADKWILAVIMHNEIVFLKWLGSADIKSFSDYVSLNNVPNGMISVQLYTENGYLVAERKVYHYKEKSILFGKKEIKFEPKAKNELEISLQDTAWGTYSVSITDADLTADDLTTEIEKGIINDYKEPFSFRKKCSGNNREMNLFLLTLKHHSADSSQPFRQAQQQGLDISGNVYYARTGKPVSGKTINFFPKNSDAGSFLLSDSLDAEGKFNLGNLLFEDSTVLLWNISGLNANELAKIKLKLNKHEFDSIQVMPTILHSIKINKVNRQKEETTTDALKKYYIIDSLAEKKAVTLPEVILTAQRRRKMEELDTYYAGAGMFAGRLGNVLAFDMEEEKGYYSNIFVFLQTRIPGLKIMGTFTHPILLYRSSGDPITGDVLTNVAVFVNETRLYEMSDLTSIPVSEIAYVKVFKPPFSYALVSEAPSRALKTAAKMSLAIAIYLKKGATRNTFINRYSSFPAITIPGYSRPRTFVSPDYAEIKEYENLPDKRITLYWNPEVEFIHGKAKIIFYNNDFSKKFLVKIEGINEWGEVVSFSQVIDK